MRYYASGLDLPANFHLISTRWAAEDIGELIDRYEAALPAGAWPNWVLGNHDRPRVAERVGDGQARVAAMLLLTLRGTPTLYYGDELGMRDVPVPAEAAQDPFEGRRDPVRTPMRWDDGPNAGFCPPGVVPWLPVGGDLARVNVAAQRADPRSLLALYRRLLALRRERDDLALGGYEPVAAADGVLAYRRDGLLVALNLGTGAAGAARRRPHRRRHRPAAGRGDRPRDTRVGRRGGRRARGAGLMARWVVWAVYAALVLVWSSTWVVIKIGLEDMPPLLGAGVRFTVAGALLLAVTAARRRSLRADPVLVAILALLPFATAYGLIYWGEQYVPSGLAAVLFGVLPLYAAAMTAVALREEPVTPRLLAGLVVAIGGLTLAFSESLALGDERWALLAAAACAAAPLASSVGNIAQKRRAAGRDAVVFNGWAMLGGGALLLLVSAAGEDWGEAAWSATALGSIAYLTVFGSAVTFVGLSLLLRELTAVTVSSITLVLPFGALLFGALLYDEPITLPALAGALLVAAGLAIGQWPARRRAGRAGRQRSTPTPAR